MVTIEWCKKQKSGIRLIQPNKNMSSSYIKMAEESIDVLAKLENSSIWIATTSYYIFYYSLYALMLRIGIKCEIHSCSLELMKSFLKWYSDKDLDMINKAFSARIDLQYYSDRKVNNTILESIRSYCKEFFIKTKDILSKITEDEISNIRDEFS